MEEKTRSVLPVKLLLLVVVAVLLCCNRVEGAMNLMRRVIHQAAIDEFIDKNIEAIQDNLSVVDPSYLGDSRLAVTTAVYMELQHGWLQNVSELKRAGPCSLTYSDKLVTLDVILGWDDVAFDYRYLLKMVLLERRGDLHGQMYRLKARVVADFDLEKYELRLKTMRFINTGKIKLSLRGHMFDKIYNLVMSALTRFAKPIVLKAIEIVFTDIVKERIEEVNAIIGNYTHHHSRNVTFVNLVAGRKIISATS